MMIGLSLYVWRLGYAVSDWAILALTPLSVFLYLGFWRLVLNPWQAKLLIALRESSPLAIFMTGKIRAGLLSFGFTAISVFVLAYKALSVTAQEAILLFTLIFVSGIAFTISQVWLSRHLHQPFATATAASWTGWIVALPFALFYARYTFLNTGYPGAMIDARFQEALQIGLSNLPDRRGWITEIMALPYAYDASKLWAVVQLKEYPNVAAIFSLDAALISIIAAKAGIIIAYFVQCVHKGDT